MATSIAFTDGTGSVTLTNGKTAPVDRFQKWVPLTQPIGPVHNALGTGVPYLYEHRCDYGAKFVLPYVPNSSQSDLVRLVRHLLRAGSVTVTTGDSGSNVYTCYLWPGSTPSISEPDPRTLERTLTLSVLNASEADMVCLYS